MKVKRRKLVALENAFAAVGHLGGIKFAYGIAKNSKKIADELEALKVGLKPTKEYQEYERKRTDLCKEYASKDEYGKPMTVPVPGAPRGTQEYVGLLGNEKFDSEIDKLEKEYRHELDKREELTEQYQDMLEDEVDFEFYKISIDDMPEQITAGQLSGIMDIVKDEEPTKATKKKKPKKKE